jgi:fructose-1-phosphate kinase PfkB-like protein
MSASPTPAIFTLTGNLLAERTLEFSDWAMGRTQRAQRESFQVGGKGINVSKMLQRLGAPTTALGFTGGATGAECAWWLDRQKFASQLFPTAGPTRIGLVVRGGQQPETTFLGPDTPPDAAAIRACADYLETQPRGQVLAICGSLPGWNSPDFDPLRAACTRWLARGSLAVDTYGPPLAWFAGQLLALVKINANELRTLFPAEPASASVPALLQLAASRWPVRRWIVTDGAAPVWFQEGAHPAASVTPPRVHEVSSTGSGDVLFACVLEQFFRRGATLAEAVTRALPYAAANAADPGVAEFPLP